MEPFHQRALAPYGAGRTLVDDALRSVTIETGDPLSWDALRASAALVVTPDGSPIRSIVTGRRPITTGTYASRKAGRPFPYESMIERAFFMHSEVDADVVDYRVQPFRLEFVVDGRKRAYIPDGLRILADGTVQIVEIKGDPRALRDPDYALKLEAVRMICERIGWRFSVVFQAQLLKPAHVYENIVDVQSWRFTAFDQTDEFTVSEALRRQSVMSLGGLADGLGDRLWIGVEKGPR